MKLNRTVAYLLGFTTFASTLLAYLDYIYMLGFPDGYITELGHAERKLAYVFIGISFVAGASFIYLGWRAAKHNVGRKLSAVAVLYSICVCCLFVIDNYFLSHLDNGVGG